MKQDLAPIALFAYNRADKLEQVIEYLKANQFADQSFLYVFCDGPKNDKDTEKVKKVHRVVDNITGLKEVIIQKSNVNIGCADSIIGGIDKVLEEHETIIIVEDDHLTSPYFLAYINDRLNLYKDDLNVASICGWAYPIDDLPETYFLKYTDPWGWGTWKRAWQYFEHDTKKLLNNIFQLNLKDEFNRLYPDDRRTGLLTHQINGIVDTWDIRWDASIFLRNMYTLHPGKSLVKNIGLDGTGTHKDNYVDTTTLNKSPIKVKRIKIEESEIAANSIRNYHISVAQKQRRKRRFGKFISSLLGVTQLTGML